MKCQTILRLFKSQPKLCHAEATTPFLNHHFFPEVSHSTASNGAIIFYIHQGRGVESLRNSPKITKNADWDVKPQVKPNKESNSGVLPYNKNVTY